MYLLWCLKRVQQSLQRIGKNLKIWMKSCKNYKSVYVHQIVRTQSSGGTQSSVSPGFGYLPDPTMILRGPNKVKHLDIVDYVNLAAPYHGSPVSNASVGVIESLVKAKTGPVWPQLEDVSITISLMEYPHLGGQHRGEVSMNVFCIFCFSYISSIRKY